MFVLYLVLGNPSRMMLVDKILSNTFSCENGILLKLPFKK